jgi:hypothetical protein
MAPTRNETARLDLSFPKILCMHAWARGCKDREPGCREWVLVGFRPAARVAQLAEICSGLGDDGLTVFRD